MSASWIPQSFAQPNQPSVPRTMMIAFIAGLGLGIALLSPGGLECSRSDPEDLNRFNPPASLPLAGWYRQAEDARCEQAGPPLDAASIRI
jgi:hypothetical protein